MTALAVGVGLRPGTAAERIVAAVRDVVGEKVIGCLATLDSRAGEPELRAAATMLEVPIRAYSAAELAGVAVPNPSVGVADAVGTGSVAEAAALLSGTGPLLITKRTVDEMVFAATAFRRVPVRAVLFDLDGTLVDYYAAADVAVNAKLAQMIPDLPADARRRAAIRWHELTELLMDRFLAGELTFAEQRRMRVHGLVEHLGLPRWDPQRVDDWMADYRSRCEAGWQAFPDVLPTLDELRRRELRVAVLTNNDGNQQRMKLRKVGLATHLPGIFASDDLGVAKPDPRIFHIACTDLALSPESVAYVGDRRDIDAVAATTAGLQGIWLNRGPAAPESRLPTISTLTDLPRYLDHA
ncbi:cobalamin biosynthesis protein [Nocardia sp. NPDC052566]|uniref:cobalamin biosynthesis protein n=1 Tax=Nocardia sp. NPDC052566 TaxID=3364330 RepID=UPI0037C8C745